MPDQSQILRDLTLFIQAQLDESNLRSDIAEASIEGTSSAGKDHEAIFTRDYLCPTLRSYFHNIAERQLGLTKKQVDSGLGTEGYAKCEGYCFSPAKKRLHILGKDDFINTNSKNDTPPGDWLKSSSAPIRDYQPCPDFALFDPLPRVVGEVKYFRGGAEEKALKDFYAVVKEVVFYLGAFHGTYEAGLIVIADASPDRTMKKAIKLLKPELLDRFGFETGIYLCLVSI